jgi:hypothetical protein
MQSSEDGFQGLTEALNKGKAMNLIVPIDAGSD